jgi:threonine/homoserine/homoserine lactone efflux protein
MTQGLLLAAAAAGGAYVLAPGPAFLALLGIGASAGRRAGALFVGGHLLGDTVWASLSLVAILGARDLGTTLFDVLGLICGIYLGILGWRALRARRGPDGGLSSDTTRPLARGVAFGLSNPKAYPVSVAMFTALLAGHAEALGWDLFAPLLAAAFVGFVAADAILVAIIGSALVRGIYRRHALVVTRVSGILFLGFAVQALISAVGSMRAWAG